MLATVVEEAGKYVLAASFFQSVVRVLHCVHFNRASCTVQNARILAARIELSKEATGTMDV